VREIGARLIEYSREEPTTARGLMGGLFPYIAVAARRMSARSISRYLQEAFGVKISAVTIAKSLRQPEKYLEPFADRIESAARRVADAHSVGMRDLLTEPSLFWHVTDQSPTVGGISSEEMRHEFEAYEEAVSVVKDEWFSTNEHVRGLVWEMLSFDDYDEPKNSKTGDQEEA